MSAVWYEKLGIEPVAVVIIALSLMLATGFLMTRITKRLKLPNVTAFIVGGILIGPYVLNLVPDRILKGTAFLPDIALAFIAFSTGEFFEIEKLRKNGNKVVVITIMESVLAAVFIFILTFFILRLQLAFSVVLAALATATAPASTIMTIRQTGAKGDFVETLLQVVALDDVVGLVLYSVAISVAVAALSGGSFQVSSVLFPVMQNLAMLVLGAVFGLLMKLNIANRQKSDNRLIIALALLFSYCGICAAAGISPLLGCMMMGTVYINTSGDSLLFRQLNYFSPPILLLFFVRSGVSFDLGALTGSFGAIGSAPLILIGVLYFFVRIIGKYAGAFAGCQIVGKDRKVRDFLGLALIPQAGVAIGLAALGARTLGGEMGNALETIILSSSVLYELIGPGCAKLSLYLSGSYSNELEKMVEVSETTEDGAPKTEVELLIERIRKIQEELPDHDENEKAYNDAAEEFESLYRNIYNQRGKRKLL
ncbi:cation:proton antiporter [Oribacterium sp. WCC10]|uniref:cation:proton antiporter n=1 Tax=Oribacterium sp. WCC10 TaxID=1855343 RepID=UPI0008F24074|nr:cation:proton antiporter [Oribacterium sp. WCC10]SFG16085.1 Kef-type K+ transport system, membrane component KefB [Oribacterium sp. WCC10]